MKGTILSLIESGNGAATPESLDTLHFAMDLGARTGNSVTGMVLCAPGTTADLESLPQWGVDIAVLQNPLLDRYTAEGYTAVIRTCAEDTGASYICIPHTSGGNDFAPALGALLRTPCITAVNEIRGTGDAPLFTRTIAGGKLEADISPLAYPAVLTVSPGAHGDCIPHSGKHNRCSKKHVTAALNNTLDVLRTRAAVASSDLLSAEVIIAAGKGVGTPEQMELLRDMASLFPRASIAGSRGACDMGLVDYGLQVGMTGKTVSPKLYIACGISGSPQHIMGMKNTGTIIAINRDPDAPIHHIADISIVEDLKVFIPQFIETVRNRGERSS
ncbi:MAG TPA: electron transfer flavoprotein subunit alpha/FixB family protein [Spirochaetota bacterium]|nr:electron transfer flavoprotein subunit alpha/FixB family protein [Spirochaetota bacterium]